MTPAVVAPAAIARLLLTALSPRQWLLSLTLRRLKDGGFFVHARDLTQTCCQVRADDQVFA
ncbi:MAG TPA: hypothetical protein DCY88_34895 [Cyanobacteria bacterium UBA11372]|nr:hypothetical protein [Cyanobacteria bacterium UBA11372]